MFHAGRPDTSAPEVRGFSDQPTSARRDRLRTVPNPRRRRPAHGPTTSIGLRSTRRRDIRRAFDRPAPRGLSVPPDARGPVVNGRTPSGLLLLLASLLLATGCGSSRVHLELAPDMPSLESMEPAAPPTRVLEVSDRRGARAADHLGEARTGMFNRHATV